MPTTKEVIKTRKSSRLGTRNYKVPPPLRFKTVKGAKEHIKANKLKVKEYHQHHRGARIQVVDPDGKPRTISIELPRKKKEEA